jgi:hypothetical protein
MNFLPFVLSFLLILVLGGSVMFNSFRSVSIERTIILGVHNAKLDLISDQSKKELDRMKKPTKEGAKKPKTKKASPKEKTYPDKRNQRNNLQTSKLNFWPCLNGTDKALSDAIYQSTVRLIENLYKETDFYKTVKRDNLARNIVEEMLKKKGETLADLFPADPELAPIYYKMLKGTNTGYPSLEEYLRIEKTETAQPVIWPYASAVVLTAILGEASTQKILAAEKANWEEDHKKGKLTKENLKALLQNSHPKLEINKLETVFSFQNATKGYPRACAEDKTKVMAVR